MIARICLAIWICVTSAGVHAQAPPQPAPPQPAPSPRLITCGWNAATVGQMARDINQMPGQVPLTGCVLTLHSKNGDPDPLATAHSFTEWNSIDVAQSIKSAASANKDTMPDNFLLLKANPGNVDWMDDQGWATIVDHYRIAAKLAREAGLRGLLLDFEPYTEPHRQFQFSRQSGADDHPFSDYQIKARQRGREVMTAIASGFPDAEIGSFFLLSYLIKDHHYRGPSPVGRGDDQWCLEGHSYGLLPAFVDGLLDVVPKTINLFDGCENGYWFQSADQFANCANGVRQRGSELVSPENREKYLNQIHVAFPVFLDVIHPTFAGKYTLQPNQTDRLALLRRNLTAAIKHSDGLVWLYGERGRWWPEAGDQALWNGKDVYPHWEDIMPGISATISQTVERSKQPLKVNVNEDDTSNVSTDSSASAKASQPGNIEATVIDSQPQWEMLVDDDIGSVVIESGQVTIRGARDGSGVATVSVQPNRRYMIQVQVVQEGHGMNKLSARWKSPDGQWESTRKFDVVAYPPDGDPFQPRTITAIVNSPPGQYDLIVSLNASRQLDDSDGSLFGNLMIGVIDTQ